MPLRERERGDKEREEEKGERRGQQQGRKTKTTQRPEGRNNTVSNEKASRKEGHDNFANKKEKLTQL